MNKTWLSYSSVYFSFCAWSPPTTFFQPENPLQITAVVRLPYVRLSDPIWMGLPERLSGAGGWGEGGVEGHMQDLPLAWHAGYLPL